MKNNSKGMTVVEVLIAMTIMTIVIGIVYGIYISNTKIISKNELKSIIQTDAQYIQNTLTSIGMQSSGIENIEATEIVDEECIGYYEVESLDLKIKENQSNYIYRFLVEESSNDNKSLTLYKMDESNNIIQTNTLSQNLYSFKIKPIYSSGTGDDLLIKSKTIDAYFELGKIKGFSDVNYEISTVITFRNK